MVTTYKSSNQRCKEGRALSKNDRNVTIHELIANIRDFLRDRDWEKFHNPKDLAESICVESAELLQLFQWMKPKESEQFKDKPAKMRQIKEELADVVIYCLSMASTLDIDLTIAILQKIEQNKEKYPVDRYKGKAHL